MVAVRMFINGTNMKGRKLRPQISKWIIQNSQATVNMAGKQIAREMAKRARMYAPRSTGSLKRAIDWKRLDKTRYIVFVKPIRPWSTRTNTSELARKVYPISQEFAYKAHWIHTSMIPIKVRHKFQDQWGSDRFVKVRRFTPFMTPAYASMRKDGLRYLSKEVKKLIKKAMRKGGVLNMPGIKVR